MGEHRNLDFAHVRKLSTSDDSIRSSLEYLVSWDGKNTYVAADVEVNVPCVGISCHTGYIQIDFESGFEPPF